jgi:3-oxoadipate enol-lactonase
MFKILIKQMKKAAFVFLALPGVSGCLTRCPEEEIKAIAAAVPDPETKNEGFDLKEWKYEKVVSETSGETYYYYHLPSKKEGAPVFVLIHGLFLDGRTFLNMDDLSEDFELIAPELPQKSSFFTGRVDDFPKLLQDFFDALKIERMYLGGVSLGGQIAMFYMVHPHKTAVDGLALITTDMVKDEKELAKAKKNAGRLLKITDDEDKKMLCLLSKLSTRKRKKADASEKKVMEIFAIKQPSFYRQVLYTARNMQAPPNLKSISVPTLVILGDADDTIPFESAQHLPRQIPGAELRVVKGGGHSSAYLRGPETAAYIKEKFVPAR